MQELKEAVMEFFAKQEEEYLLSGSSEELNQLVDRASDLAEDWREGGNFLGEALTQLVRESKLRIHVRKEWVYIKLAT